jgi:hypothetical protein
MLLFSSVGSNQFLNFIVVTDEKENHLRRCRDEHECQPVIQADPALENGLGEAAEADPGMRVRVSPAFKNPVDGVADFLTL